MSIKTKIYRLLRKSERYTKTDMVYLAKGGFWLTLGQVVSSLSAFLLAIAFANLLPKETYGTYKYILSLMGLLAIPTLSGMGTAVTRAVAQGNDGSFLPALKLKIKWGLLGGLASVVLAGYYYLNNNIELTLAFLITAIFIPFLDSFALYGALLGGKKKFDVASKYGMWVKIIASLSIFITLFFTKNLLAILFIYLASYSLLRLIILKLSLKYIDNKKEDAGTISYGKHLSLMGIIGMVAGQIDKILVFHFLGAGQLAIYSIAIAMPEQIKGIFKNLSKLIFPKMVLISNKDIKKRYKKLYLQLFILILIIIIIYILSAPYIFKLLFPKYLLSILYSQVFILALFNLVTIPANNYLSAKKRIKKQYLNNILSGLIKIILTCIATPFFGIWGIIFAKISFRFISAIITHILFIKDFKK